MKYWIGENMVRRIAIFSVYDKNGIWGEYHSYILSELKKISKKIIVIVNGTLNYELKKVENGCDIKIIYRENKGFDAGAYRHVLMNYIGLLDLYTYTELILCNDTFFGPFVSFSEIFSSMDKSDANFWGLYRVTNDDIMPVICSCFYVFRLKDNLPSDIYNYFYNFIKEDTTNIYDVYRDYEVGLYSWLISRGYKDDTYIKQYSYNMNTDGDILFLKYKFPIIKKSFFLCVMIRKR